MSHTAAMSPRCLGESSRTFDNNNHKHSLLSSLTCLSSSCLVVDTKVSFVSLLIDVKQGCDIIKQKMIAVLFINIVYKNEFEMFSTNQHSFGIAAEITGYDGN